MRTRRREKDTMPEGTESQRTMRLGEILIERGIISEAQLANSLSLQRETGARLGMALVQLGYATPDQIADSLAWQEAFGSEAVTELHPDAGVREMLTEEFCRARHVLPVGFNENQALVLAMVNPADIITVEEVSLFTGLDVAPLTATMGSLNRALDTVYPPEGGTEALAGHDTFLPLLQDVLSIAIRQKASHVHFEAEEDQMVVRLRVDGVLHHLTDIRKEIKAGVVSRLKFMGQMDIAQQRLPQEGRGTFPINDHTVDLSICCVPTVFGESITVRVLDDRAQDIALEELGMGERELSTFTTALKRPWGQVLVTGPRGSGRSTTLYAGLERLKDPRIKIYSVEDWVERTVPGILQAQTRPTIGVRSAVMVRSLLASDPDVLMIGEIDDPEVALLAGQAALTGRLVLAGLHTHDAATAITRLLEMGLPPYMVASGLECVVAQRLVRKLCSRCKELVTLTRESMTEEERVFLGRSETSIARAKGCNFCLNTGYSGRVGLFEVLRVTEEIRQLILDHATVDEIRDQARAVGMRTLREDGRLKVLGGLTTIEEVERVTL
jgi:type IV pilus assembly protein PilB